MQTMPHIKVPLQDAQLVKQMLLEKDILSREYSFGRDDEYIYYPVRDAAKDMALPYLVEERQIVQKKAHTTLKAALENKLSKEELALLKTSYDTVGTIAVLEIDEQLKSKEKIIAETLLEINKQIKTVVAKDSANAGEFRTKDHRYIAGQNTFETLHKENGCQLYINVNDTYFSVRLSTERKRIREYMQPNEKTLVMFSGAAPYPCVLAKHMKSATIDGVEKNPKAHELGLRNVKKNKIKNVHLFCGDVREVVPTLENFGCYDRVLMPLPKSAEDFLDIGINALKKGGMLHFYDFLHEELFDEAKTKIHTAGVKLKRLADFKGVVRCGQHAPRVHRICVDAIID